MITFFTFNSITGSVINLECGLLPFVLESIDLLYNVKGFGEWYSEGISLYELTCIPWRDYSFYYNLLYICRGCTHILQGDVNT